MANSNTPPPKNKVTVKKLGLGKKPAAKPSSAVGMGYYGKRANAKGTSK